MVDCSLFVRNIPVELRQMVGRYLHRSITTHEILKEALMYEFAELHYKSARLAQREIRMLYGNRMHWKVEEALQQNCLPYSILPRHGCFIQSLRMGTQLWRLIYEGCWTHALGFAFVNYRRSEASKDSSKAYFGHTIPCIKTYFTINELCNPYLSKKIQRSPGYQRKMNRFFVHSDFISQTIQQFWTQRESIRCVCSYWMPYLNPCKEEENQVQHFAFKPPLEFWSTIVDAMRAVPEKSESKTPSPM